MSVKATAIISNAATYTIVDVLQKGAFGMWFRIENVILVSKKVYS